jgi:hypothetical protein
MSSDECSIRFMSAITALTHVDSRTAGFPDRLFGSLRAAQHVFAYWSAFVAQHRK